MREMSVFVCLEMQLLPSLTSLAGRCGVRGSVRGLAGAPREPMRKCSAGAVATDSSAAVTKATDSSASPAPDMTQGY